MKLSLAGRDVRSIRHALDLTVEQFATVLAVHPGTVKRWEGYGVRPVTIDGIAANVLAALQQRVERALDPETELRPTGNEITKALLVGGAILALAALLNTLTEDR